MFSGILTNTKILRMNAYPNSGSYIYLLEVLSVTNFAEGIAREFWVLYITFWLLYVTF
jgi:hypothetical protein